MKRALCTALLLVAAACGGDGDDTPRVPRADAAPPPVRMSEAEVIGTMLSATEGLSYADSAALSKVTQPAVLRYAQVLRADHRAIADEVKAVADSMKVAGTRSEAGDRMRTEAGNIASALQDSAGDAAMEFVDGQVEVQRQLIGALDSAMIPAATTATLRQVLQDLRPAMVAHLQRAEQLKQMLTAAKSAPRAAAATISPSAARRDTTAVGEPDPPAQQPAAPDPDPAPPAPQQPQVPPPVPDTIPVIDRVER